MKQNTLKKSELHNGKLKYFAGFEKLYGKMKYLLENRVTLRKSNGKLEYFAKTWNTCRKRQIRNAIEEYFTENSNTSQKSATPKKKWRILRESEIRYGFVKFSSKTKEILEKKVKYFEKNWNTHRKLKHLTKKWYALQKKWNSVRKSKIPIRKMEHFREKWNTKRKNWNASRESEISVRRVKYLTEN